MISWGCMSNLTEAGWFEYLIELEGVNQSHDIADAI